MLREKKVLFTTLSPEYIYEYLWLRTFGYPDGFRVVGYPMQEESISENGNGMIVEPYQEFVITKSSSVQDGAWDFLVSCIEMQTEQQVIRNPHALYAELPCTYTGLDTMLERFRTMELEPDILADAAYGSVIGHRLTDLYAADPAVRESYILTEEDCAFLRDLIVNAGRCVENDEDLLKIIIEEAGTYFAGQYDLETTVKTIQSRASIYMSEQFG